MSVYTPKELADTMLALLADGTYTPDEHLQVTIWCAEDAGQWTDDDHVVTTEEWSEFLACQRHHLCDEIAAEVGAILGAVWETWTYENTKAATDQTDSEDARFSTSALKNIVDAIPAKDVDGATNHTTSELQRS